MEQDRVRSLTQLFQAKFGSAPQVVVRAPGRVNIIGEHTDYNEGFVFPVALDKDILIAAGAASKSSTATGAETSVENYSQDYDELDRFSPADFSKRNDAHWPNYLRGTIAAFLKRGIAVPGFQAVSTGNIPQGAGLSSSAAYSVASGLLLKELTKAGIEKEEIAIIAQEAENNFVGVNCGIMDQFISVFGEAGHALLIDCRSLTYKSVPLHLSRTDMAFVIIDSGVRRGLVDSKYNERRDQCMQGIELLAKQLQRKIKSLRDVEPSELDECAMSLPEVLFRRCRHVVTESARVLSTVEAFENGDLVRVGSLLFASHESLRLDYEVSCPEVDLLVELTLGHPRVYGARMTGGGFGGCVIALMKTDAVQSYKDKVLPEYSNQVGINATVYECRPSPGACTIKIEQPA